MEVPSESFHKSSWHSRTCYPRRAFNQGLTDDLADQLWWLKDLWAKANSLTACLLQPFVVGGEILSEL